MSATTCWHSIDADQMEEVSSDMGSDSDDSDDGGADTLRKETIGCQTPVLVRKPRIPSISPPLGTTAEQRQRRLSRYCLQKGLQTRLAQTVGATNTRVDATRLC